ncbi:MULTISPECIES: hypothetical protein [Streptosporangium]|uniref:Uncharacterized protein n=1 Tax=Streptosporangium brasiliense TaxID=47480 RepID=A0ABT9RKJ4_9ACTN|nr:hypothetical protein [Streptosporangium brasiliense]MDP9869362.1 hypothetical protein [Streptosporangium brasiliense]
MTGSSPLVTLDSPLITLNSPLITLDSPLVTLDNGVRAPALGLGVRRTTRPWISY